MSNEASVKVKCPYCNEIYNYKLDEITLYPIAKMEVLGGPPSPDKYVAKCKNKDCGKSFEFWMRIEGYK
ncbi:MAG: hypothetical protein ACFFE4_16715 [Candidatus Thorarchaeota archaeon]